MAEDLVRVAEDSARGGFFLFSGTVAATVVMAIASILIGRLLGPELYGQYTLVFIIPQLLYLFTDLGINQGVTKYAASFNAKGETGRTARMIKYALLLRTLAGIILFLVNYTLADFFASTFLQRPDTAFYIRIASTAILFQATFATVASAFVGLDKAQYNALATNIQALAKALISITLVLMGFSLSGAVLGHSVSYVVATVAGAILLYMLLRRDNDDKTVQSVKSELKTLMHYGTPLYISILLTGLVPFYQNLMLANYTTNTDVGNYKAAANFSTLISTISIPITTALLPAFSKIDSSATQKKVRMFFKLANKYTALIVIPAAALLITYSNEIVKIIYGSTYQSASLFLSTNSLLYLLAGFGYLTLSSFYNGLGKTKTTLTITLITFLTLAALSPTLTQAYGVQGLIAAFLIASTASTIYAAYKAKREFQIEFDTQSLAKIYVVSIASSIPSLLIAGFAHLSGPINLTIGTVTYLATYATLTPLTGIITRTELQTITKITQRIRLLGLIARPILKYEQKIVHTE